MTPKWLPYPSHPDLWTVQELKEALKERGLPISGKKHVLIERLETFERLINYDGWTVQELKEALKVRGLPVSGKKRVLIERLEIEFPSSEGLEDGDLVYICQVCGEKFKSRNKYSTVITE